MKKLVRKKLRYILAVILFVAIFVWGLFQITEIVRKKLNSDIDMIHSFYDLEKNSLDVVFIGSSHCYYGISPNELWDGYGITSYVMGSPSQTPALSYYLLKEVMKYQKPKVVFLETYGVTYNKLYTGEGSLRNVVDSMKPSMNRLEMILDLCKNKPFAEKMTYLFPIMKYHDRWDELRSFDFNPGKTYLLGSKLTLETRIYEENQEHDYSAKSIYKSGKNYLNKIIQYCKENEIELVLVSLPMSDYTEDKYRAYYRKNLTVEKMAKKNDVPFLFLEKQGMKYPLDPAASYIDAGHLNYYGQVQVAKELGDYLQSEYGLISHKGEAGYQIWDEYYAKYSEYLEKLLEEAKDGSNIKSHQSKVELE